MSEERGPAPLTFGQLLVWRDIQTVPRSRWHEANWVFRVDVPLEVSLPSVRAALDRLAERHGSLRTTYDLSDLEHPTQSERGLEELPLDFEIVTLESTEAVEDASVRFRARPFDLKSERPYRALLVNTPGARTLLISKHHIAIDSWSMDLLTVELTAMFHGNDDALPPPSENLCLLAHEQRSAAWQRRQEAAERHVRTVLSTPAARFRDLDPAHGALMGYFESARLYSVANQFARQSSVSLSTVVISAYARAVSQLCTDLPVRFGLIASNRFGKRWATLVASMNQVISIPLHPGEDCMQQTTLEALQTQSLRAYRLALHDIHRMRPAELGLPVDTDPKATCIYNFITPAVSEQTSPIQDGDVPSISWNPVLTAEGPRCYLEVGETTTSTLTLHLYTNGLGEAATVQILQAIHSTIMRAGAAAMTVSGS